MVKYRTRNAGCRTGHIAKQPSGLVFFSLGETPIPTHNLLLLAKNAKLDISQQQTDAFREITTYNIEARYDDYKRSFYKKVTKLAYIKKWMPICEEVAIWLEKQY